MIASRPPMGWNSWDCYGTAVTEPIVRANAAYMAEHLCAAGYEYVVVDIQWYQPTAKTHEYEAFSGYEIDDFGRFMPAPNRFPSSANGVGFKPLADYVHALGLKFGIHIMRGIPRIAAHAHTPIEGSVYTCADAADPNSVCAWNPDMYRAKTDTEAARDYYRSILKLYASWGVDYIKCDDIAREYPAAQKEIELLHDAARACGRDIVLSLSPGPAPLERAEHLKQYANMWRITDDFWDDWRLLKAMFERAEKWCIHSAPGHWPDADMLPIGALRQNIDPTDHSRFTPEELRTMMTLWCMMRAPLIIGADMPKLADWEKDTLIRPVMIQRETWCGHPLYTREDSAAWIAPLKTAGGAYIALFNLSDVETELSIDLAAVELEGAQKAVPVWGTVVTEQPKVLSVRLQPHDCEVWRVTV